MHSPRKGLLALLLIFGLAAFCGATTVRAEGASLVVNEVTVAKFQTWSGSLSPEARMARVASTLERLIGSGEITARKSGREFALYVGSQSFMTITSGEAMRRRTTTQKLASTWMVHIRKAAELPPLQVSDSFVRLPVGTTKLVPLSGSAVSLAQVSPGALTVVEAKLVKGGIELKGLGAGRTQVGIQAGEAMITLDVDVRPVAANFPQTLEVAVTGSPAIESTVRGAVEMALRTRLEALSDAKWTYQFPKVGSINAGSSRTYRVRVSATSQQGFPSNGSVSVVVRNEALPQVTDAELWYCNDPETIRRAGPLFSAPLRQGHAARLLFHHLNAASQPLFIRVQAINDSDKPAQVVLIPGNSRPDRNPVRAGVVAADQYVRSWQYGSGEVMVIPPRCTLPIALRSLSQNETASGLCSLRLVSGPGEIQIRTDAWPPFVTDDRWEAALRSVAPWREVGTRPINEYDRAPSETSAHIYPNPYKAEKVEYEVGGRYGFVRIGQKPIRRQDNDGTLDGNFGVIYNIKAKVGNPTQAPIDVEVVFEASAGYSGGLFILNGRYVKTPLLQPKEESQIARFRMDPGAVKSFDIMTLPISGCSYPATITIRPISGGPAVASNGHR